MVFRIALIVLLCAAAVLPGCTRLILQYEFDNDTDWSVQESDHFLFHFRSRDGDGYSYEDIISKCESTYASIVDTLGIDFDEKINIYFFKYGESKFAIHDFREGKSVDPLSMSIYTVDSGTRPAAYEISQIIVKRVLGPAGSTLMENGLAIALADNCMLLTIKSWMTFAESKRKILGLNKLLFDVDKYNNIEVDSRVSKSYRLANSNVDYYTPQTGSFVQYMIHKLGVEKTLEFYMVSAEDMTGELETALEMNEDQIEADYQNYITETFFTSIQ